MRYPCYYWPGRNLHHVNCTCRCFVGGPAPEFDPPINLKAA